MGQWRESIIALMTVTGGTSASKNIRGEPDAQGFREMFMLTKAKSYLLVLLVGVPRISEPGGESVAGELKIRGS